MDGVHCVVVNYNAGHHLKACIEDLLAQYVSVKVVVVDNGSTDTSLTALFGAGNENLEVICNRTNRGFGAACNQGAAGAATPYLAFINPDCRLEPGALRALVEALEKEPQAAIAGSWVTDALGTVQRGTRRLLPSATRVLMTFTGLERWGKLEGVNRQFGKPLAPLAVEAVNGACFAIRRSCFEQLNGFDEAYFLHCEDLDLFKRVRDAGFRIVLAPESNVIHAGGVSSSHAPFRTHWRKHVSMARYWRKHHGKNWTWAPVLAGLWLRFTVSLPSTWLRAYRMRKSKNT